MNRLKNISDECQLKTWGHKILQDFRSQLNQTLDTEETEQKC